MTRVDLITGFLGAGKTTFIHRYLRHLDGQRVLIIENEYGSVSVDARLLRNEPCEIEDLSGVCMCCKGRGQFISMLKNAARQGYDRVLVEPSGVYDVDEFFSVMHQPDVSACCEIGCVLTIVDARVPEDLSVESEYLMFTQLAAAGTVILSKVQFQSPEAVEAVALWLDRLYCAYGGHGARAEICAKDWDDLTDEDFIRFQASGCHLDAHQRQAMDHAEVYSACISAGKCLDEDDLRARLHALMTEPRFGRVIRVKGYARDLERRCFEVNCTRTECAVSPAPDVRRGVLVIIGQDLDEDALDGAFLPKDAVLAGK